MTGDELRAAREAAGKSQAQLAEALGKDRKTVIRWEAREGDLPEDVAAQVVAALEGRPAPVARQRPAKPAPVPKDAAKIAEAARAEVQAMRDVPPYSVAKRGGRRPTAAELKAHPARFAGPDVWVIEHNPPIRTEHGSTIRLEIVRFSANGQGAPSMVLVGSRARRNPDKEALAVYRPFKPALAR